MKMVEPQLVTNQEVQTGAPGAKQLKKNPESESVKALYNLRYGLLLCGIDEEMGDTGLLRWQQFPPDCSLLCWWCQHGPSWVT